MFPWNYGFQWNAGHIIFLGAFYSVLAAIAATVIAAARGSRRDLAANRAEEIGWREEFHDLPARDRVCRHALTGEIEHGECLHAFDCRQCETHARLTELRPLPWPVKPEEDLFGMAFPLDRFYHRGHAWAQPEPDGTVTVGLDDLGQRLLGVPDAVELPQPGARVETNGTAFRVHKRDANVRVLSPVDGEVVETGGADRGWYLKVKLEVFGEPEFRHLLRGAEVRPWLLQEMERLQLALSAEGAPTLADGGVPVADIAACYPQMDWDAVCGEMFLEP